VIQWQLKQTPLLGLVELGTVDSADLGWLYDKLTGAMTPAPDAELAADLGVNLPLPTKAHDEVVDFFQGAGLRNFRFTLGMETVRTTWTLS